VTARPAPALLEALLSSGGLLRLLDEHVRQVATETARDVAAEVTRDELARATQPREWLTISEAAAEFGCTTDAMRMRVKRRSVESCRMGHRIYVRAPGANGGRAQ
jgi:hypothetical protein